MNKRYLIIILLLLNIAKSFSQADTSKNYTIKVLPIVSYAPETSLVLGLVTPIVFNQKQSDSINYNRPSTLKPVALATFRKQYLFNTLFNLYLKKKWVVEGLTNIGTLPVFYFGLGNNTRSKNEELVAQKLIQVKASIFKQIKDRYFIGLSLESNYFAPSFENNSNIFESNIAGTSSGGLLGIGPHLRYDTRDNILYPSKGNYAEVINHNFFKSFYTDYNFVHVDLRLKKYWNISDKNIFAHSLVSVNNFGNDIPFYIKEYIGGLNRIRGIYFSRYLDDFSFYSQHEYRRHIWKRFQGTLFYAFGDVSNEVSGYKLDELKHAYGLGIRYQLTKKDKLNLRLDYSFSQTGKAFYLSIGEAF